MTIDQDDLRADSSGPGHYAEAERLVALASRQQQQESHDDPSPLSALTVAQAQVHATLALASATLDAAHSQLTGGFEVYRAWTEVGA